MMKRLAFMLICMICFSLISACEEEDKANLVAKDFKQAWEREDFEKVYSLLLPDSTSGLKEKDFKDRLEKIYTGMGMTDLNIDLNEMKDSNDAKEVSIPYTMTFKTVAGPIKVKNTYKLVQRKEGFFKKEWYVKWDYSYIYPSMTKGDKFEVSILPTKRGEIVDRNQSGLALNMTTKVIGIIPEELPKQQDNVLIPLSEQLHMDVKQIRSLLNAKWVQPQYFVPIKTLPVNTSAWLIEQYTAYPGVTSQNQEIRYYPFGEITAHLIGYTQPITADELKKRKGQGYAPNDFIGKTGLEKEFEDKLRGEKGAEIVLKTADGKVKETVAKKEPKPGEKIQLTLDSSLQALMYEKMKNDAGAGVAIHPKTGEILSLVSTPSYDPNLFITGLSQGQWEQWNKDTRLPLLNRYTNRYAPGSTFKPITAAIGLENKTSSPSKTRTIDGLKWQKDSTWGEYYVTRVNPVPKVNLRDMLVYSDNIYIAKDALEMGIKVFEKGAQQFGFNEKFDLPLEILPSQIANKGLKTEIQLADTSYGQGQMLMSPLHLAYSYTPFVNKGTLLKPVLLYDSKQPAKGKAWKEKVISEETAKIIHNDLIEVVRDPLGSGHGAYMPKLEIAGKSGTAELKDNVNENGKENGWFVGYNANDPELLVAMLIEDVKYRGGGGYTVKNSKEVFADYFYQN